LAEHIREARILLLATYRPGYRPAWIDKSYAGQIPLQPLSRRDSIHIVRSMVRAERLVELVTDEIVTKADGNPFFSRGAGAARRRGEEPAIGSDGAEHDP
jgi:predicted ATPase